MSKYIVTVHEITNAVQDTTTTVATQEVFKLGVDEFDPLAFCAALAKKKVGRPAKKAKEAGA